MKRTLPLRGKIALWCALLTGIAIAVFATGTLFNLYFEQIEAADIELETEAMLVSQLLVSAPQIINELEFSELASSDEPWVSFAIFRPDGSLHRAAESLPEPVVQAALPVGNAHTVTHPEGTWRVQAFAADQETIVVAYNLEEVHGIVLDLLLAYVVSLPFAALIAGFGGWTLAGRALAPIRALTASTASINAGNLSQRVEIPPVNDEVGRLAQMINQMLARLEQSFRQAERFAADASHEMRTPLTVMQGEIDSMLRLPDLPLDTENRLLSLQEEANRMQHVSDNLLLLARFDAGKWPLHQGTVDLSTLFAELREDADIFTASRHINIGFQIAPGLQVRGDKELLRRLFLNLLDNASKFNVPGGRVACQLANGENTARVIIGNTGPGIPEKLRPRLFERFFRVDGVRTSTGHGLGLALCREIARAHGGDVGLTATTKSDWTEFKVQLPLSTSPRPEKEDALH